MFEWMKLYILTLKAWVGQIANPEPCAWRWRHQCLLSGLSFLCAPRQIRALFSIAGDKAHNFGTALPFHVLLGASETNACEVLHAPCTVEKRESLVLIGWSSSGGSCFAMSHIYRSSISLNWWNCWGLTRGADIPVALTSVSVKNS